MTDPSGSPPLGGIRLGVSSCLLGNPVRYDGGHKLDRYLRDTLGRHVEYVHYVSKFRQPYLAEQVYMNIDPAELQLRNHC